MTTSGPYAQQHSVTCLKNGIVSYIVQWLAQSTVFVISLTGAVTDNSKINLHADDCKYSEQGKGTPVHQLQSFIKIT